MNKRTATFGIILIVLGLIFWLNTLDVFDIDFGDIMEFGWPLILIAIGAWLIIRGRRRGSQGPTVTASAQYDYQQYESPSGSAGAQAGGQTSGQSASQDYTEESKRQSAQPSGEAGKIRYDKFLGDLFVDMRDIDLQNVEVSSFIGDVEIKLHGARLRPGLNRMVISGFIGDVRVLVPPGMSVFVQSSNFVGDTELLGRRTSGFGNSLDAQTPDYSGAASKLYIAVNVFISDIRVYEV
ncbi:hypothetical protein GF377_09820 [candidate division GN15 bacterium]|nr:hypothetical protein [candidate division GN15 bacterium]